MIFQAYILQSGKDKKYYYGSTNNLARRLNEHNQGKVTATRSRRPLKLIYQEDFKSRAEAIRRERFFKKRSGYKWLKKIK